MFPMGFKKVGHPTHPPLTGRAEQASAVNLLPLIPVCENRPNPLKAPRGIRELRFGGAGANDLCDKDANDLTPATGCEIRFTP